MPILCATLGQCILLVTGVIVMLKQDRHYRKMEDVRIAIEQSHQKARRASWPEMSDPIDIPLSPGATSVPNDPEWRNKRDIYSRFIKKGDIWSPYLTHKLKEKEEALNVLKGRNRVNKERAGKTPEDVKEESPRETKKDAEE